MKKHIFIISIIVFTNLFAGQLPWENGNLMVSENGRYLQHANGKPFFGLVIPGG